MLVVPVYRKRKYITLEDARICAMRVVGEGKS